MSLLADDVRVGFAQNPLGVLRDRLELTVTAVDQLGADRAAGGACDGVSFLEDDLILYARTPSSRRENFTLAHELGHWLVENAPDIHDWLADQDDPGQLLETICDRIAQSLLLPESEAIAVVGAGPVRAQHVLNLYAATQASRPVCAIALAKTLPGLGAVAIIDREAATVAYASVKPDPEHGWPAVFPWPGQTLSSSHPLLSLRSGDSTSRRLSWQTAWGTRADFYVDAVDDGRRIIAVFADTDLWGIEAFHAPKQRDFDTRPLLKGFCCGTAFEVRGYPCGDCERPYCPNCGDCRCDRDAKRAATCTKCFLQFQPHLVVDGVCVDCRA